MTTRQSYFVAKASLINFLNGANIPYKNISEIARAAGLNSSRTAKKAISGARVSTGTANAIYRLCMNQGFSGEFEEAFDKVTGAPSF